MELPAKRQAMLAVAKKYRENEAISNSGFVIVDNNNAVGWTDNIYGQKPDYLPGVWAIDNYDNRWLAVGQDECKNAEIWQYTPVELSSFEKSKRSFDVLFRNYLNFKKKLWRYVRNLPFTPGTWNNEDQLRFAVRQGLRNVYQAEDNYGASGNVDLLYQWIRAEYEGVDFILREADIGKSIVAKAREYRANFIANFDRAKMAYEYVNHEYDYVPQGDVHYIIGCVYDHSKEIYTNERHLASEFDTSIHDLWFDYFGVPEDEVGLIQHIDY